MKLTLTKGALSFDLSDLVDSMDQAQRDELCRYLLCQEKLFAAVLEAAAGGHFFEEDADGSWWFGSASTAALREQLMPLMPAITRDLVAEQISQRKQAQTDADRHREWAYKLYHAWPQDHWRQRPEGPADYKHAESATVAEVQAVLEPETKR